jgi:RNA polymerase-binding transcription factor DksA
LTGRTDFARITPSSRCSARRFAFRHFFEGGIGMAKSGKKAVEKKQAKPASKAKAPAKPAAKAPAKPAAKAPAKPVAKVAPKQVPAKAPPAKPAPAKAAPAKPAPKAPSPAPAAKPAPAPLVIPKLINSGPKEVIPAVAPKQVWRASNEAPPPKKKPGKGAPPPSIRDPRKEALEALRQQQLAAERAANKGKKIDFTNVKSVAHVAAAMKPDANGYVVVNGRRVRVIAAKAPVSKKKAPAKAAVEKPRDEGPTDAQIAAIKTRLSAKELNEYKQILLEARAELIARVTGLEDEALRSSGGNLSNMPLHMADIGTDTFDQDLAIGMAETERELLREIDEALDRVVAKTYGVCQLTGKPIPKARLDAKPWAKYTVEAARQIEKMGGR